MVADDDICSSAAELKNAGVNGLLRSKFAVSDCKFVVNRE